MSFSTQRLDLLARPSGPVQLFANLLETPADQLEALATRAQQLTRQHFGRTMRLFAPLYLSNECVNNCTYCGFSRDNPILRTTLSVEQVATEARHLHAQGFRNLLLVAGEHPKFVSEGYLQDLLDKLAPTIPTLGIEVGPMEHEQYRDLVSHGAEGLVVYQETYHQETYTRLHTAGPKKNYHWRLDCPERAYAGGFRRLGVGALFGLAPWKEEALALATHLDYLRRHCWKAALTVAFPRMKPHAGNHLYTPDPQLSLSDQNLLRLVLATRLAFPQVGIVLSTREPPALRDALFPLGVTHVSAASNTAPGGYTGAGRDDLHLTVRGRRVELDELHPEQAATGQFCIDDQRSVVEIEKTLLRLGLDPVWKDWDRELLAPATPPQP